MRAVITVILIILAIVGIVLIYSGMEVTGAILLGILVAYLIFSVSYITNKEIGMLSRFGKPICNLMPGSGLYFAPWGFYKVEKENATVTQDELPADPEFIYREEGAVPKGMFPPIRIKFGPPDPADVDLKDSPYNKEMVAEVIPVVAWKITDAIKFFGTIKDVANCRKLLADKAIEVFAEDLATMTPAKALKILKTLSVKMLNQLKEETKDWGIEIFDAYIKPFNFSHSLNTAVEQTAEAEQHAKVTLTAADAEQARLLKTGLAIKNTDGTITLVPDAATKANADALTSLKDLKGTLVLGGGAGTVLDVSDKGGKK